MNYLVRGLLAITLLLLALAMALPFTESGTAALLRLVQRVTPLEIDYAGGRLVGDLHLEEMRMQTVSMSLQLSDTRLRLAPACLWRSAVCFDRLQVQSLELTLDPQGESPAPRGSDVKEMISFPVPVEVRELLVDTLTVRWAGGSWQQDTMQGVVALEQSTVTVERLEIADATLLLEPTQSDKPGEHPLELPQIELPLELLVDDLLLKRPQLLLGGEQRQLQQLQLSGQWQRLDLELDKLRLQADELGMLDLSGAMTFADAWPLQGKIELALPPTGPLDALQIQASIEGDLSQQSMIATGSIAVMGYRELGVEMNAVHTGGELQLQRLELRDADSDNRLSASGQIELADGAGWDLRLDSDGFPLPQLGAIEQGYVQGSLRTRGNRSEQGWWLALEGVQLQGEVNGLPTQASGYAGIDSGLHLARSELQAEFNDAVLTLHSTGQDADPGRLEVHVADLGRWQRDSFGALQLTVRREQDLRGLQLQGHLRGVRWRDLSVTSASLQGHYLPGDTGPFSLTAGLREFSYDNVQLDHLELQLEGDHASQSALLYSHGDFSGNLAVSGGFEGEAWRGEIAPSRLQAPQGEWRLDQAVPLAWNGESGQLQLGAHCWRHPRLQLCTGESLLGAEGSGRIEARGQLAILDDFLPRDLALQGELQMQLQAAWSPGSLPLIDGTAIAQGVSITRHFGLGESVSVEWDSAQARLEQQNGGLSLALAIERDELQVLSMQALLPSERDGPLSGGIRFQGLRLQTLAPWAPNLDRLEGVLLGELELAGTVEQPLARGEVRLRDGQLAIIGNPTELENLELELAVDGNRARLDGSGTLGGGDLLMEGDLVLDPHWQLQLFLSGSQQRLSLPPSTEVLVSEKLQLTASADLLQVTGDVTVHEGILRHEELPEGSVAVSPDVVEVDLTGKVIREQRPFDLSMDVWLHLKDRFQVVGTSLRATVGGDLHLLQSPGRPAQVFGSLNVVGGQLQAFKQRLQIRRGTVAFSGDPGNPEFDVRAEREIREESITVGAQLLGTLDEPVLQVYSDPVMSQSEAMSYLVRGRGLDSGAGADGTALALAIGADFVNQSGVVSELNRIPGISDLAFGSSGTQDDTAATLSGYLGERIYLSYGIGLYEPINVMTARFYFNTRLWLEVVSRLENSVDLYYSFDID